MTTEDGTQPHVPAVTSRRAFLGLTAGTLATGAIAGCSGGSASAHPTSDRPTTFPADTIPPTPVPAAGAHQAGVTFPQPPQPNLLLSVMDLRGSADVATLFGRLGTAVLSLTGGRDPRLLGLPPGDLTVTVGVGSRLVARVDRRLPGADALPRFGRHEQLGRSGLGGDVALQICASDPLVVTAAAAALDSVGAGQWDQRWRQTASRAQNVPVTQTLSAPRNLLGFVDGIVGPRTAAEFAADVWLRDEHRTSGGTIMAVRRMTVDVHRFAQLSLSEQEAVFGRTRADARPLTGGTIATDPDLGAKTPAGAYVIPADAHLRRANPASAGVPPMLRRSYSFDGGLLFVSFQNELQTFVATLDRMTTMDALLGYTVTTHAASFLILPGFTTQSALGSTLFRG